MDKQQLQAKLDSARQQLMAKYKKIKASVTKNAKTYSHRKKLSKDRRAKSRAHNLAKLPKSRTRRVLYYLNPKRFFAFWFSKKGLILGLKIAGIGLAVMIFIVIALFAYFRREIDADPKSLQASLMEQTTRFYDHTGKRVIYNLHGDINRTWVELEDIAEVVQKATIAIEDKDFYSHNGFSISGVIRANINNLLNRGDGSLQGGSTITQQFVKNTYLSTEQTVTRKIKELILSLEIERLYSKDEILEFYLNKIPYGGTEYGIEVTSKSFFNKSARDLTLDEAAMIAALPQAPSVYSPYGDNTDALIARRNTVMDLMVSLDFITQDEANEAKAVDTLDKIIPLEDKDQFRNLIAPHFVVEVQKQLIADFGESMVLNGGLKVTTSLDYGHQRIARRAVRDNIGSVTNPAGGGSGDNVAITSMDIETGRVTAMVGSRDYNYPKYGAFNAAISLRQPGSSFKIYDYAGLFYDERWGPDSYIYDTRATFGNYAPSNFDFRFRGRMTVRQALGESRNIPAVKAMYIAGLENVLDIAKRMGNKSLADVSQLGLSAALGAGEVRLIEHVAGYATLARGGKYLEPVYILKVENSAGEILFEWEQPEAEQVIDPQVAYLVTEAILDDAARAGTFGLGNPTLVVPGLTHTVKTGTTDDSVDGWMMGYSRYLAVGSWVGNHDSRPMHTITNSQNGPIFTQFLREVHKDLPNRPIYDRRPPGIQVIEIDTDTGYAATAQSRNRRPGLFPSWHRKQLPPEGGIAYEIDKISGNLATNCTPELARESVKASRLWPEILPSDPMFGNWSRAAGYTATGSAPTATDDVHKCSDSKPVVEITSVTHQGDNKYTVNVAVSKGTHPLDKLEFRLNNSLVHTRNVSSNGSQSYTVNASGSSASSFNFGVRVIDKVLYSSEDFETVARPILSSPSGTSSTGPINFVWSPIPGASYEVCWQGPTSGCQSPIPSTSSSLMNVVLANPGSYTATVEAFISGTSFSMSPTRLFVLN